MTQPQDTFEQAYVRLEQILEQMNSKAVSLEESLKLFEEADRLIVSCNTRLTEAEQKIEILLKNRNGTLSLNENEKPATQPFMPTGTSSLTRNTSGFH
jgi:exodeoxyribonuclease VII small subunit